MMCLFLKYRAAVLAAVCSLLVSSLLQAEVTVKLRDMVFIDGFKENQVLGFGLVVGLQGSGDSKSLLTQSSLKNLLKNLGLESSEEIKTKNIAAVLLTAKLPPFARVGDRVDVSVSSIGDAKSLEGGVLVQSPLKGADSRIYVVAQGPLSLNLSTVKGAGKGIKTVAQIAGGGIVERGVEPEFISKNTLSLVLKHWDFSVASQIMKAVAEKYPEAKPAVQMSGKILVNLPKDVPLADFIAGIEALEITPVYEARVVVNEKDGTIVMGGEVKISEVMISKEGLTVKIEGGKGGGVSKGEGHAAVLKETASVKDLVDSLNYIGASTRDIIAILKVLKDAGALHAELIIK